MLRFPAEWEKQSAVLIAWPHEAGDFGEHLAEVEHSYRVIAQTISRFQRLLIVCQNRAQQQHIVQLLGDNNALEYLQADYDDIWVRDTTFLTVVDDDKARLLNFQFNGWGGKYPHAADNALNRALSAYPPFNGHDCTDVDLVLEGGSIESDGLGTLLTTKQCLLNANRNPRLTQQDIEKRLSNTLGARRVLWIDQEHLAGDDTDAHIDTLARFCTPDTIAYTACNDPGDAHYNGLKTMERQLQALRTAAGTPYRLIPLALPRPVCEASGKRLPANYANFLILNDAVLVPAYDDPMDSIALEQLRQAFPQRELIAVPCRPIVRQNGSLHCMTMQFPEQLF